MFDNKLQRFAGTVTGGLLVAGVTLAVGHQSLAQRARAQAVPVTPAYAREPLAVQDQPPGAQQQPGQPGQPGGPGGFPQGFPGQPGGPGGFPQGFPFPMMGGGGGAVAANQTRVFVLFGNQVFALDAGTLKVVAQGSLPVGGPGPGGFGPGGPRFGPGGFPPGGGPGQPFGRGRPGGQPAPGAPGGQGGQPQPTPEAPGR